MKETFPDSAASTAPKGESVRVASRGSYRKRALDYYRKEIGGSQVNVCAVCGFGIPSILEVAHLDQDRANNSLDNLAVLCPNCHKMHDIGLMPTEIVRTLRDEHRRENWELRIKDAGAKAATTRRKNAQKKVRSEAGKKAWETRTTKSQDE